MQVWEVVGQEDVLAEGSVAVPQRRTLLRGRRELLLVVGVDALHEVVG